MDSRWRTFQDGSVLIAFLGLVYVLAGVVLWFDALAPAANTIQRSLYELVVHGAFGVVMLGLGIHLERSELPAAERRAVVVWCCGGFLVMLALSVWGHLEDILAGTMTSAFVSEFVVFTSIGGAFGGIAGANWGRAKTKQDLARQNRDQRETLTLVTRIVSHDIKNDMTILAGHVDLLADHVDEEGNASLAVIEDRIWKTVDLLEDVRALVRTIDDHQELTLVDAFAILRREVTTLSQQYPAVEIETDIEASAPVLANALLGQLFGNLLSNAVRHNDPAGLTITVAGECTDDVASILIADDGVGVDPAVVDRCFDLGEQGPNSSGDGVGLYLVSRLADMYGGEVEHVDEAIEGAAFRITLPLADSAT